MIRKIIHIDEEKCNGCGICANACHEGAIDIVDGKAKLVRESLCDGFGDCLPGCPTGAISLIGPSTLFAAYKTIKNMEKQGNERGEISEALKEKIGEKNPDVRVR